MPEATTGDNAIMTSWIIMGGGAIPLILGFKSLETPNATLAVFTPVLMIEGVGLTLNGVGLQLNTAPEPSLQDKFNIAGRLMLGLGLFS